MIRILSTAACAVMLSAPAFASGVFGPGTAFCFGDGSMLTPCPCAPPSAVPSPSGGADGGCASSFHPGGGALNGSGAADAGSVVLAATRLPPDSFSVFLAGTGAEPDGQAFGDGVRCAGGALVRFGGQVATGGSASYPRPEIGLSTPLHEITSTPLGSGTTIYYQLMYRNAASAFCNPSPVNCTNGYQVSWN